MKAKLHGPLLLLLTALTWGTSLVAQQAGSTLLPPFTFNASRSLLAALALLPVIRLSDRKRRLSGEPDLRPVTPAQKRDLLVSGVLCGLCLFGALALQQVGIAYTTVSKAGFIASMYIVLVPLLGALLGGRVRLIEWAAVVLAGIGMYLLCINGGGSMGFGDMLMLLSALCYAVQILLVGRFVSRVDGVRLSCAQFFTCGLLSAFFSLLLERFSLPALAAAAGAILYAGAVCSGGGFTLQILGQRDVSPTVAALIMSTESIFSLLCGWLLLGQPLTPKEWLGSLILFLAILLPQVADVVVASLSGKKAKDAQGSHGV